MSVVGLCAWDRLHSCFSTLLLHLETTIQRHSTANSPIVFIFIFMFVWFLHMNETFHELNCLKATALLLNLYHLIRSLCMTKHFLLLATYVFNIFIYYY